MPRGKRTTLTVDRSTFEMYFFLGSSGISVARDAMDRGIIRTPYESIELVCLVNQLEAEWHYLDTLSELEPRGKDEDYEAAYAQGDRERCDQIILQYIGRERLREMLLEVQSDVRDELRIPEVRRRASRARYSSATEPEDEAPEEEPREELAPPFDGEPAILPIAPWRFERHFELHGMPYWIALDAFRQSVIGTPYEMVTMLCDIHVMYSRRLWEHAWLGAFERYKSFDELEVAVKNGTFARDAKVARGEKFDQMFDDLMLEIRTAFGVPETEEIGKAEKYKLWLYSHRSPVN